MHFSKKLQSYALGEHIRKRAIKSLQALRWQCARAPPCWIGLAQKMLEIALKSVDQEQRLRADYDRAIDVPGVNQDALVVFNLPAGVRYKQRFGIQKDHLKVRNTPRIVNLTVEHIKDIVRFEVSTPTS